MLATHACCCFHDLYNFPSHCPFYYPTSLVHWLIIPHAFLLLSHVGVSTRHPSSMLSFILFAPSRMILHFYYVQILLSRFSSGAASSVKSSLISIGGSSPSSALICPSTLLVSLSAHNTAIPASSVSPTSMGGSLRT